MNSSRAFLIDEPTAGNRGPEVDLIAVSACMQGIAAFAWRLAHSEVPVLLMEGERGSGKGTVARAIHYQSPRRDRPFIIVNCTVSPEALLEKQGVLAGGAGGTVLLSDIDALPLRLQDRILGLIGQPFPGSSP